MLGLFAALVSAVSQAWAHALLKAGRDRLVVRAVIGMTGTLAMIPLALIVPQPTPALAPWLVLSALTHAAYQLVLIQAYAAQDFSVAYPLARGTVPLATSVLAALVLDEKPTAIGLAGAALVGAGLVALAASRTPSLVGILAALAAGACTTAYTLIDARGVRATADPATFIVWFFICDGLLMTAIAISRRGRAMLCLVRAEGVPAIVAGLLSLITYGSALIALRYTPAGLVAAVRETSVVFGLAIAVGWLGEPLTRARLAGTALVAAGAALVATGALR
jgi:drug/metabolite transporter (DMT)-like permease